MQVIEHIINGYKVYIEVTGAEVEVIDSTQETRDTQLTGISETAQSVYASLREILTSVAEDVGADLSALNTNNRPEHVEIQFNLAVAAKAGPMWIISSSGEYSMKVSMSWKLSGTV